MATPFRSSWLLTLVAAAVDLFQFALSFLASGSVMVAETLVCFTSLNLSLWILMMPLALLVLALALLLVYS